MKKGQVVAAVVAALVLAVWLGRDWLGIPDVPVAVLKEKYGQDARYVEVLGTQARIKESGVGEPLLLLHGFGASADTWDGWQRELQDRYHVIAVDVAPFALTGPLPGRTMDAEALQDFMDALVDRLGLTQFHLAGNSLGGYIAWNYARRHPDKVRKLVLVDSAGYPMPSPLPVRLMQMPVLGEMTSHFSPYLLVADSLRQVYGDPSLLTREQVQRYHEMMRREGTRPAVVDLVRAVKRDGKGITEVKVPTLILWGSRDTWIPPEHAALFQRDIEGSQLIMYEGLGHIPMEEDPVRTANDVRRFLQEPI